MEPQERILSDEAQRDPLDAASPIARSYIAPRATGSRWTTPVLGLSFLAFGFAVGELAGFTVTQGASQLLLTSVFTFASGVLLSYAGFRRILRASGGAATLDPLRVGAALGCFSMGLAIGTPSGVAARCNRHFQSWIVGETVEHSSCVGASAPVALTPNTTSERISSAGVMANAGADECTKALVVLNDAAGDREPNSARIVKLISEMRTACRLGRP
jgi:hypothetical protein